MNKIRRLLKFLRLTDNDGLLSITNIFMIILLYKIAVTPALSIQDISIMFVAVSNYSLKKFLEK